MTSICDMVGQYMQKKEEEKRIAEEQAAKDRYWKIPICYDDDEDYTIAIAPVLPTKEPVNSLSMGNEHLDTIPATESDEVIKSSVENLVPIPSESEGIPDSVCDVPLCNNPTPLEAFKEHSETLIDSNNDYSSSEDDSYENIDYVDASPLDAEIVSSEVVEIIIWEVGGIDTNILLTIKDDILREKLLNVNLLIANIKALKDNPTPSSDVMTNFYADADHIERKGVVAVYLYQADFLNMFRSSLIFRSIHFLLPIGVIFIMRSSPVNSLTSYLHQSMIISALRFDVEPGAIILLDEVEDLFPTNGNQEIMC
ncbi:hypothetical protein Tco_1247167 [Tanacetum coccineum]